MKLKTITILDLYRIDRIRRSLDLSLPELEKRLRKAGLIAMRKQIAIAAFFSTQPDTPRIDHAN